MESEESIIKHDLTAGLPVRTELHLARKVWHMLTGLTIIFLYWAGFPQGTAVLVLSAILAWSLTMEVLRLRNPVLNEKCIRFFNGIIRTTEVNQISSVCYYIASSIVAIEIFPKPVAILSLFFLALGDPVASLAGILYSQYNSHRTVKLFNGKSLHGTAAGFTVCALVTCLFLRSSNLSSLNLIRMTLLGGFAGALAELLPLEIDDNFSIPVVSGFILWLGMIAIQFV